MVWRGWIDGWLYSFLFEWKTTTYVLPYILPLKNVYIHQHSFLCFRHYIHLSDTVLFNLILHNLSSFMKYLFKTHLLDYTFHGLLLVYRMCDSTPFYPLYYMNNIWHSTFQWKCSIRGMMDICLFNVTQDGAEARIRCCMPWMKNAMLVKNVEYWLWCTGTLSAPSECNAISRLTGSVLLRSTRTLWTSQISYSTIYWCVGSVKITLSNRQKSYYIPPFQNVECHLRKVSCAHDFGMTHHASESVRWMSSATHGHCASVLIHPDA